MVLLLPFGHREEMPLVMAVLLFRGFQTGVPPLGCTKRMKSPGTQGGDPLGDLYADYWKVSWVCKIVLNSTPKAFHLPTTGKWCFRQPFCSIQSVFVYDAHSFPASSLLQKSGPTLRSVSGIPIPTSVKYSGSA